MAAQGRFATIKYTWADEGQPQDGLLTLGADPQRKTLEAVWIDSWHMADKFMLCKGAADSSGVISVQGSYAAPPGPDWGWRIVINPCIADRFQLRMYNISPDGEEALAAEAGYFSSVVKARRLHGREPTTTDPDDRRSLRKGRRILSKDDVEIMLQQLAGYCRRCLRNSHAG